MAARSSQRPLFPPHYLASVQLRHASTGQKHCAWKRAVVSQSGGSNLGGSLLLSCVRLFSCFSISELLFIGESIGSPYCKNNP